jgi:hypothetical protein
VAGVAGPTEETVWMAGGTAVSIPMPHRKTVRSVIARRLPGIGRMAGCTARAKLPAVLVPVAGRAGCWRPLPAAGMAGFAGYLDMCPRERERSPRVIEGSRFPGTRRMAGLAVGPELPLMCIVLAVAGDAGSWGAFPSAGMARFTSRTGMRPGQLKYRPRMIEGRRHPAIGRVAG